MHDINSIEFYYDKMHGNRKKTRLWWKIIPKSNVEHIKSNVMLITFIYTLLGTYFREKYFKISQASSRYFKLIQNISKYFRLIQYISRNLIGNIPNYILDEKWMNYIHDDVKHDLSMKEGCSFVLFCLYLWHPPNRDALDNILGVFGKLF